MKKLIKPSLLTIALFAIALTAQAQVDFSGSGRNFMNVTLKPVFPLVISSVFLVCAMFNIGLVWGENKEWKKFATNVLIYSAIVLAIIAAFTYFSGISI